MTMHGMTVHGMAGSKTRGLTKEENTWLLWAWTSSQQVEVSMKRHESQNLKWEPDFKWIQNSSLNQNSNWEPEFEKRARIRIQAQEGRGTCWEEAP